MGITCPVFHSLLSDTPLQHSPTTLSLMLQAIKLITLQRHHSLVIDFSTGLQWEGRLRASLYYEWETRVHGSKLSLLFFLFCYHLLHTPTLYRPSKITPMPDKLSLKPSLHRSSISPTLSPGLQKLSYKKQLSKNKDTVLLPHLKDAGTFSLNMGYMVLLVQITIALVQPNSG